MYPPEYQHILDFLDSNPEYLQDMRTRLLMPDLVALPEQFAQLVGLVTELSASFHDFAAATDRRLTSIETDVGVLKTDVGTLKEDVGTLKTDVGTLKEDVGTLKTDVSTLKEDVGTLKTDVSTLKEDVGTLKTDVSTLKEDVGTLKTDVGTLNTNVASLQTSVVSLQGSDLENRARLNILNIAMNELALNRGRVLLATGRDTDPGFLATINAAEEAGLITEQQADHVLAADIVIRARRTDDRRYVHAVFEISRTIRLDDIRRADDRAATVAAATGEPTIAAVVGEVIHPQQQRQANEMDVKVLLPPMLQQQTQSAGETADPIC